MVGPGHLVGAAYCRQLLRPVGCWIPVRTATAILQLQPSNPRRQLCDLAVALHLLTLAKPHHHVFTRQPDPNARCFPVPRRHPKGARQFSPMWSQTRPRRNAGNIADAGFPERAETCATMPSGSLAADSRQRTLNPFFAG